jgi:glycine dehydrogenase subunit 1
MPLSFGGPYLGFMTATSAMGRKLPGRIVGETKDVDGRRAYVLTLQAREQHIRREKASSNVCSNQALCALTASVYMAAMGADGLRKTAVLCTSKAHYLKEQLEQAGLTARYDREFFHEFVTESDTDSGLILKALEEKGILGGLPLSSREILWCATEQNRKEDMDQAVQIVKEVCGA